MTSTLITTYCVCIVLTTSLYYSNSLQFFHESLYSCTTKIDLAKSIYFEIFSDPILKHTCALLAYYTIYVCIT